MKVTCLYMLNHKTHECIQMCSDFPISNTGSPPTFQQPWMEPCNYRLNGLQQLELMDAEYSPCDSFYFFLRICSMPLDAMPGVLSAIRALDDRDASAFAHRLIAPE